LASVYLEDELDAVRRTQVESHLEACVACRQMVSDVRRAIELCRAAEDLEPAPWLVSKIWLATVGERKPTLRDRVAAFFRPAAQPRVAYALAMAVFSLSLIVNVAGINLHRVTLNDLNPYTWVYEARRTGYLLYARVEKFHYDLRVVYEIESRFRQLRPRPDGVERETPKPEAPPGGSTDRERPGSSELASVRPVMGAAPGSIAALGTVVAIRRSASP